MERNAKDEEGYLEFRGNAWAGRQAGRQAGRNERVVVGKLSSLPPSFSRILINCGSWRGRREGSGSIHLGQAGGEWGEGRWHRLERIIITNSRSYGRLNAKLSIGQILLMKKV